MPHDTGAPVGKLQILHRGQKRLNLDLYGLCQKLPRTRSQNIGQWIADLGGLTKGNNIARLVHGVSLSSRGSGRLDTRLDTPPISRPHHPLSRIARGRVGWDPMNILSTDEPPPRVGLCRPFMSDSRRPQP